MIKSSRQKKQFFLFLVDLFLLIFSIPGALFLRTADVPTFSSFLIHLTCFSPTIIFWVIAMYTFEFYVLENIFNFFKSTVLLIGVALLSMLVGIASFYLFFSNILTPKRILAIYIILSFILIFSWRYFYNLLYLNLKTSPNVVFIGYNKTVSDLIPQIMKDSYCKYDPIAIFDDELHGNIDFTSDLKISILKTPEEFSSFVKTHKIDIVVLGQVHAFNNDVRKILFSFLNEHKHIYFLPEFYEISARKIPLGALNDTWVLSKINLQSKKPYLFIKRFFGVCFALLCLILLSPVFIIVAIMIKCESKGPVFFTQIREGKNSKPFSILKFRTMTVDNNNFSPTSKNDNRITKVGSFLRKSRLDEIPQMINILKGDMALIGPRPERPELAVELEKNIPFYRQRVLVKPGITGWDQVSGEYHSPSVEDTIQKMQYDLFYVKNLSFVLDFSIFFKTITTVFKRSGR